MASTICDTQYSRHPLTWRALCSRPCLEAQRLEIGRLSAEVRACEKQRNQHCGHSELLLKVGRCTFTASKPVLKAPGA